MQIVLFLLLVLMILLVLASKRSALSGKSKTIFLSAVFFLISLALIYEFFISKKESSNREIINAFDQGKMLICENYEVNNTKFRLVTGTLTFVGQDGIRELKGVVIPVSKCKIK